MDLSQGICFEQVSKKYDGRWILKDIEYSFKPGMSTAFVGHNGCGKSTILKLLSGIVVPTKGKVIRPPGSTFSYVPEKFVPLPLTARKYLTYMGKIDGLGEKELKEKIKCLAEDFFIDEMLNFSMTSLSKGTLQKIGVIQALLKKSDFLLLDEPLSGQDEASQGVFVKKINELREQKTTIFMSCHEQWLVDAISDQVFTVLDEKMVPYTNISEKKYILYFEKGKQETKTVDLQIPLQAYGTGFVMCMEEEKAQEIIMNLLLSGYILKGMYDENSKFAQISASNLL